VARVVHLAWLMKRNKNIFKNERGQSATEYMLIIAVVVLGVVSAASHFIPVFNQAVAGLAQNVAGWLTTNQQMVNP
jgi:Flp pilus assembly pilin Flp